MHKIARARWGTSAASETKAVGKYKDSRSRKMFTKKEEKKGKVKEEEGE